jgi:predicted phosphoribosyltransferase
LRSQADEVVCAITPEPFHAVGLWYEDFAQTTDEEVRDLLAGAEGGGAPREDRQQGEIYAKPD